jgi:hypothetical protein
VSAHDYRVNAEVRRFLVSHWVDVSRLQIGTTNGIVYLIGYLDTKADDPTRRTDEVRSTSIEDRALRTAQMLDKQLRRLPDVRDVIFKLENVHRKGRVWHGVRTAEGERERHGEALAAKRWGKTGTPLGNSGGS